MNVCDSLTLPLIVFIVLFGLPGHLVREFGDCKTFGSLSAAVGASKSAWKSRHIVWVIVPDVSEYGRAFFFRVKQPKQM
jgi:hypothetical protein